ncbi:hypothetical protein IMCC1989_2835 [gamma proteobacterium IMCC1989]|nr:hypothetical protein IMCC1989_2835 [gamma proteobacterium IMCC1989]
MQLAKSTNIVGGFILFVCGIVGCFFPDAVANYYGFVYEQLEAKTTVRVLAGLCMGVGGLLMYFACCCYDQRPVLLSLGVILISFAAPRLLGLIVDGIDQPNMWYELLFEISALLFVVYVHCRCKVAVKSSH